MKAKVSVERLEDFLTGDRIQEDPVLPVDPSQPAVKVAGEAEFAWDRDDKVPVLRGVPLELSTGSLTAIVGGYIYACCFCLSFETSLSSLCHLYFSTHAERAWVKALWWAHCAAS